MGPAATVRLLDLVVKSKALSTEACDDPYASDSQHTPFIVYNNPLIPNNNRAALGQGPSPVAALTQTSLALRAGGATHLALACSTAYACWSRRSKLDIGIPKRLFNGGR